LDEALSALGYAGQANPEHAATFYYLGLTLRAKGLAEAADAASARARRLDPKNTPTEVPAGDRPPEGWVSRQPGSTGER
jgi:cytochrome c-type biogenesis protein CcmH/NrfG